MPEISRFFGILIKMQYRDHAPPHFHVWYGGEPRAVMDICRGRLSGGSLPRPQLSAVTWWTYQHQSALIAAWNKACLGKSPGKIPPLR